jgi:hypothetical protein
MREIIFKRVLGFISRREVTGMVTRKVRVKGETDAVGGVREPWMFRVKIAESFVGGGRFGVALLEKINVADPQLSVDGLFRIRVLVFYLLKFFERENVAACFDILFRFLHERSRIVFIDIRARAAESAERESARQSGQEQ